jgi:hypothetical protein
MKKLETNIAQTIYELEIIFSQFFFYLMEYLPIYLSFEVNVEGLVQYR